MKILKFFLTLAILLLLAGCESMGWNGYILRDTLTPNASSETTVRTWDNGKPTETQNP
jgi:hypothetical protein